MSYDLVVWDGERPDSDAAAAVTFHEFMDALEIGYDEPPSASIAEYVDLLVTRWPEDPPWASEPIIDDAVGPLVYFHIEPSRADDVVEFASSAAFGLGLVCFDPQLERML